MSAWLNTCVGGDDDQWHRGTHMAEAQNLARELMETPSNMVCVYVCVYRRQTSQPPGPRFPLLPNVGTRSVLSRIFGNQAAYAHGCIVASVFGILLTASLFCWHPSSRRQCLSSERNPFSTPTAMLPCAFMTRYSGVDVLLKETECVD